MALPLAATQNGMHLAGLLPCRKPSASLMLVCKQWQRVYLSCAAHSYMLICLPPASDEAGKVERWLLRNCQRIERVGRLCARLEFGALGLDSDSAHPVCLEQLGGMLRSIPPTGIADLRFGLPQGIRLPAGLAGWLGAMTQLTTLVWDIHELQQDETAGIAAMTQLRELLMWTGVAPAQLSDSLLCLRQLTWLKLFAEALPPLEALSQLQQLRILGISEEKPAVQPLAPPLALPVPSAFPCLEAYKLTAARAVQVSCCCCHLHQSRTCVATL